MMKKKKKKKAVHLVYTFFLSFSLFSPSRSRYPSSCGVKKKRKEKKRKANIIPLPYDAYLLVIPDGKVR